MPRPGVRQRLVYCDCLDCIDRAPAAQLSNDELAAVHAVAQQLPPPKGILLMGSGLLRRWQDSSSIEECTLPHLDKASNEGCLGIAAVRSCTSTDVGGPGFSELAQCLDVHEQAFKGQPAGQRAGLLQSSTPMPSLPDRFKGMQVVACSSSTTARALLQTVGAQLPEQLQLHVHPADQLKQCAAVGPQGVSAGASHPEATTGTGLQEKDTPGPAATQQHAKARSATAAATAGSASTSSSHCGDAWGLPSPTHLAAQLLAALGPGDGSTGPDMLLLHLNVQDMMAQPAGAQATATQQGQQCLPQQAEHQQAAFDAACEGLLWLDALVAQLMQHKDVRERVLLSVMVTPQGQPYVEGGGSAVGPSGVPVLETQKALLPPGALLDPRMYVMTPRDLTAMTRNMPGMGTLDVATNDEGVCAVPRPQQSWQFRGMQSIDAAIDAPVLYLRRLPGVVRRDRAQHFSLQDAITWGALGGILIDHVLPDIAYKLGRALKYGA